MNPNPSTDRTRVKRLPERGAYDKKTIYSILDEGLVCHVGFAVEGQPFVIPMAYAFKKPVVITDVGSLPENVDDGNTGYIVPPKDSEKLAQAIIDLLIDDEKRKEMGLKAYQKTQDELSWRNIAPQTVEIYKKALAVQKHSK